MNENQQFEPNQPPQSTQPPTKKKEWWKLILGIHLSILILFSAFVIIVGYTAKSPYDIINYIVVVYVYYGLGIVTAILYGIFVHKKIVIRITFIIGALIVSIGCFFIVMEISTPWTITTTACTSDSQCKPGQDSNYRVSCVSPDGTSFDRSGFIKNIVFNPVYAITVDTTLIETIELGYGFECRCNESKQLCELRDECSPFIGCL